jgi:hypothetical protein
MEKYMRASGRMASKKVREFGKASSETLISANGHKARQMDSVFINGKTETDTKVNGSFVLSTALELICLQTATRTPDNTSMVNLAEQVSINGKTPLCT